MNNVVIVGAGIAGLAAAQLAAEAGLAHIVLEAKSRLGGRAYTECIGGVAFDHGCEWLHSASVNPLVPVAKAANASPYASSRGGGLHRNGEWQTASEYAMWERAERRFDAAIQYRGHQGIDEPVARVVRHDPQWAHWGTLFDAWFSMVSGIGVTQASTLDHFRYRDTGENLSVPNGLGRLIQTWAGDNPNVYYERRVNAIDFSQSPIVVTAGEATYRARYVIVTVSTGVLAADAIAFYPSLPSRLREAITQLPMGHATKGCFIFRGHLTDPYHPVTFFLEVARAIVSCRCVATPAGHTIVKIYAGGDLSRQWEALPDGERVNRVLTMLCSVFGRSLRARLIDAVVTAWGADRDIRGAYSAAAPGHADARRVLGRSVNEYLHFAG
ncbi:MAG: FAD-dependent oxidoreductase, partial [Pseudomonadota bacterium]